MGKVPLSYLEIDAYMRATRTDFTPWEVDIIIQLSHEYIVQGQKKEAMDMPPYLLTDEFTYLSSLK